MSEESTPDLTGETIPSGPSDSNPSDDQLTPSSPTTDALMASGQTIAVRSVVTGDGDQPAQAGTSPRGRLTERFEVLATLGHGGMGRVYKVRDHQVKGRDMALKVLRKRYSKIPEFQELFFNEIKSAQGFVSPHVNQVRDTGITDAGQLFLTMDLVDGESLRAKLKRERSLSIRHALEVARQMLEGLQSGHDKGIVHRDVKPENTMLAAQAVKTDKNPFGVDVRLLDFGLAGLTADLEKGSVRGTPRYMSPEQAKGERLDPRSDLFSVGIVLYEMLVGSRPFHGKTVHEVISSVIDTDLVPLIEGIEHVDKRVRKLLKKALAKQRDDRFQSASDFIQAIERVPAFQVPTETPAWAGAVMVVLLAGAGAAGWFWWQEKTRAEGLEDELVAEAEAWEAKEEAWDQERRQKQSKIEEQRDALTTAQGLVSSLQNEKTTWESDQGDALVKLQGELGTAESQIETRERENQTLSDKVNIAEMEILQLKGQLKTAETAAIQAGLYKDPGLFAAASFKKALDAMAKNDDKQAFAALNWMLENPVIRDAVLLDGKRYVKDLATLLDDLNTCAADDVDATVQASAAPAALERVQELLAGVDDFGAVSWIGLDIESADQDASPEATEARTKDRLDRLREQLERRKEAADEYVALLHEKEDAIWIAFEAGLGEGKDPDPSVLFSKARRPDGTIDERLQRLAGQYVDGVEGRVVQSGELNPNELEREDQLASWQEGLEGLFGVSDWPERRRISWLRHAQRFHAGEPVDRLPRDLLDELDLAGAEPQLDWRAALNLQIRLLGRSSAWPMRVGQRAVFRQVPSSGKVQWWDEEGLRDTEEDQWKTKIRLYVDGLRDDIIQSDVDYQRIDRRYMFDKKELRLGLGEAQMVARFDPAFDDATVHEELRISAGDLASFREQLDAKERMCLVVEDDENARYWISPELGVVRVELPGNVVRELIFSE